MPNSIEVWDGTAYLPIEGAVAGPSVYPNVAASSPIVRSVGDVWTTPTSAVLVTWDDSWQYPTLLNGWVNYAGGFTSARYRKTVDGLVQMEGLIKSGTIGSYTVPLFTLPPGYRPAAQLIIAITCDANVTGRLDIAANGNAYAPMGSNAWFSIKCQFFASA